ncbi:MAG: hypothetical protein ACI8Q1_000247 [Parvicella sp.]|jgi:hypothetical protein
MITADMYKIIENNRGKLKILGEHGEEAIHVFHCAETIEELKEDVANIYIVAESSGNFARLHLITEFSETEALEAVADYLREKEGDEEPDLIAVMQVELEYINS